MRSAPNIVDNNKISVDNNKISVVVSAIRILRDNDKLDYQEAFSVLEDRCHEKTSNYRSFHLGNLEIANELRNGLDYASWVKIIEKYTNNDETCDFIKSMYVTDDV
jgi:hypothetical protein